MLFRLLSNRAMLAARLAFCCGINHQCAQLLMPRAKNILRCRTPLCRYCTFCLSKLYLVTEKDCMAMVKFCCPCHGTPRHAVKTKPRPHLNPQRRRHGRGLLRWWRGGLIIAAPHPPWHSPVAIKRLARRPRNRP